VRRARESPHASDAREPRVVIWIVSSLRRSALFARFAFPL
jgi:hypothetical protein